MIWRISILLMLAASTCLFARNVDLSTVPSRNSVQLTIYNSEDLTLVRETRTITFKKGANPLQFSWANTRIDPSSVHIRFLSNADKLELLDTTFPNDKPQMLYWNIQSETDGPGTVEITYFTAGITWSADYVAIADKDEKNMRLESFVRVRNNSGEEYENAEIRLVVGTINLVEKIALLANIPMSAVNELENSRLRNLREEVMAKALTASETNGYVGGALLPASAPAKPKEIIKEGLSEYFIYTIEGTETINNGWSKRLRSFDADTVPFKIQYRYRPLEYGDQLVRMYILTNNKDSKLGTTPLPDGTVRVFRDNGRDGLSFLCEQTVKYIPIGDKIELNLGTDRNVVFELIKQKVWRDQIWMQFDNVAIMQKVDDGAAKIDVNSHVVGWDEHALLAQRIRNYTTQPIEVEIRRSFGGHVVFRSALSPTLHDFQTVQYTRTIAPASKSDFTYEVVQHQGSNIKQNNVTLEELK